MLRRTKYLAILLLLAAARLPAQAGTDPAWVRSDTMIAMRDGVRL